MQCINYTKYFKIHTVNLSTFTHSVIHFVPFILLSETYEETGCDYNIYIVGSFNTHTQTSDTRILYISTLALQSHIYIAIAQLSNNVVVRVNGNASLEFFQSFYI